MTIKHANIVLIWLKIFHLSHSLTSGSHIYPFSKTNIYYDRIGMFSSQPKISTEAQKGCKCIIKTAGLKHCAKVKFFSDNSL